jgi:hypothetical protein
MIVTPAFSHCSREAEDDFDTLHAVFIPYQKSKSERFLAVSIFSAPPPSQPITTAIDSKKKM